MSKLYEKTRQPTFFFWLIISQKTTLALLDVKQFFSNRLISNLLENKKTRKRDLNKEKSKKEIFSDATQLD